MSYAYYAANAPPGKLDQVVDADNADLHLSKIADEVDHEVLVNDFVPLMGIKNSEVKDVEQKYKDQPKTQRYGRVSSNINFVPYCQYSRIIRHISHKRLSLVRQWFLFMNNKQLLFIEHLYNYSVFPSCGDRGIGA